MHENQDVNIVSRDNIKPLIQFCLQAEQDRGLSKNSIVEIKRYLNEFSTYCECQNIYFVKDLTPPFLKDYMDQRCKSAGPNLKKAVVWSLRKFGKHLALLQVVKEDPARNLRHPKFHPRSELPEYLSASQLKNLLEYAANNLELRDFAIISLLATTEIYTHLSPRHFKELMNLHPYQAICNKGAANGYK